VIQLTPSQQDFVESQVATGAFRDPGEVLQAALELLGSRQQEYAQLVLVSTSFYKALQSRTAR
jgi:Arc/MetJ-type ribon-helix-helix transcriptional regulator